MNKDMKEEILLLLGAGLIAFIFFPEIFLGFAIVLPVWVWFAVAFVVSAVTFFRNTIWKHLKGILVE